MKGQWLAKRWTIPGHVFVDAPDTSGVSSVSVPNFELCLIKSGRLLVSESAIDAFAGKNVLLKARLSQLADEADRQFQSLSIGPQEPDAAKREPKQEPKPEPKAKPERSLKRVFSEAVVGSLKMPMVPCL